MNNRTEKDRISAILFIIVFLLAVAIVVVTLLGVSNKKEAQKQQATPIDQIPVEDPGANVIIDTPPTPIYTPANGLPSAPTHPGSHAHPGAHPGPHARACLYPEEPRQRPF